jgi:hypothetical protein
MRVGDWAEAMLALATRIARVVAMLFTNMVVLPFSRAFRLNKVA